MKYTKIFLLTIICLFLVNKSYSQSKKKNYYLSKTDTLTLNNEKILIPRRVFIPDHLRIQYAGAIGFISIGTGYNIGKRYEATLMFGLDNKTFGNSKESIFTLALKNSFNLYKPIKIYKRISFIPTIGASINWGYTNNTFNKLPEHYPNSYYFQNKIHLAPFIGSKIRYNFDKTKTKPYRRAIELYAELGTIDAYLLECIRTEYVKIDDILNLAIGINIYFE